LTEGKPNRHGGNCRHCGAYVAAEAGVLERTQHEGQWLWSVAHRGECPTTSAPAARNELPRWALYCDGRTPEGNAAHGVALVDGDRPDGECYPVNDAAKAMLARSKA